MESEEFAAVLVYAVNRDGNTAMFITLRRCPRGVWERIGSMNLGPNGWASFESLEKLRNCLSREEHFSVYFPSNHLKIQFL